MCVCTEIYTTARVTHQKCLVDSNCRSVPTFCTLKYIEIKPLTLEFQRVCQMNINTPLKQMFAELIKPFCWSSFKEFRLKEQT